MHTLWPIDCTACCLLSDVPLVPSSCCLPSALLLELLLKGTLSSAKTMCPSKPVFCSPRVGLTYHTRFDSISSVWSLQWRPQRSLSRGWHSLWSDCTSGMSRSAWRCLRNLDVVSKLLLACPCCLRPLCFPWVVHMIQILSHMSLNFMFGFLRWRFSWFMVQLAKEINCITHNSYAYSWYITHFCVPLCDE